MAASIIVAPPDLAFHSSAPTQTFEIYNLHQYPVHFVVKVTAPEKYIISNKEGMVNSQCKVTISVTHIDICVTNENVRDRFRIFFSIMKNKKLEPVGQKDVSAILYSRKRTTTPAGDSDTQRESSSPVRRATRHQTTTSRAVATPSRPTPPVEAAPPDIPQGHHLLFYLLPIAMGVGALWLPTQGTVPDTPWYLEVSMATKNIICFLLGVLVTLFYYRVQQADR